MYKRSDVSQTHISSRPVEFRAAASENVRARARKLICYRTNFRNDLTASFSFLPSPSPTRNWVRRVIPPQLLFNTISRIIPSQAAHPPPYLMQLGSSSFSCPPPHPSTMSSLPPPPRVHTICIIRYNARSAVNATEAGGVLRFGRGQINRNFVPFPVIISW